MKPVMQRLMNTLLNLNQYAILHNTILCLNQANCRSCGTGSVTRGEAEEVGRQTGRLLAGGTLEED